MGTDRELTGRIGFIGLGAMGQPMALSLIGAGYEVLGHDVSGRAVEAFEAAGGLAANSPREVAAGVDLLFTMLPAAADVEQVLIGPDGAADGARPGTTFVDTSTIDPGTIQRIAGAVRGRGIEVLDGGVSGSVAFAAEHRVTLMIGGDRDLFERWRPVFEALSATLIHTGGLGSAKACKLANNLIASTTMVAISEAFRLTTLHGVDSRIAHQAMSGSWANGAVLASFPPVRGIVPTSPADRDFVPAFSVDYMVKDIGAALLAARQAGAALPVLALVQQMYLAASGMGEGHLDFSAVYHALERLGRQTGDGGGGDRGDAPR